MSISTEALLDRDLDPNDIRVYVRDANYKVQHEVDDYISLSTSQVRNDIDTWEINLSGASDAAPFFTRQVNPGGGILVVHQSGETLLSGPIASYSVRGSAETGEYDAVTIGGASDDIWLAGRLIYPDYTKDPAAATDIYYRTGVRSTEGQMHNIVQRNLGDLALTARKITGFTQSFNFGRGPTPDRNSPKYRFETLLSALQSLSVNSRVGGDPATDLNFRIIQVGEGLQFQTYRSTTDAVDIRFSRGLRSLREYEYTETAATTTYAILGAGLTEIEPGETAVRVAKGLFTYSRADDYYPRRMEAFVDVGVTDPSDADTPLEVQDLQDQLDQAAADEFESNGGQIGATLLPRDIEDQVYGVDYFLGDMVTVQLPQVTFAVRVQEVETVYDADSRRQITVSVGTEDGAYKRRTPGAYKRLRTIKQYMDYLKVNK